MRGKLVLDSAIAAAALDPDIAGPELIAQFGEDAGIAVAARYLPDIRRLEVMFSPSETKLYDFSPFPELVEAGDDDLAEVEVSPAGIGILFPRLNRGLEARMLYRDRFETPPSVWE